MKVIIKRASDFCKGVTDYPPLEGAKLKSLTYIDSLGHEAKRKVWVLTVSNLQKLCEITERFKCPVIFGPSKTYKEIQWEIIIYDDYME